VRVTPRSQTRSLEVAGSVVSIHVRSAPEDGKASEEARRVLAKALGIAPSRVSLRSGARSRTKVFEVSGLEEATILARAQGG